MLALFPLVCHGYGANCSGCQFGIGSTSKSDIHHACVVLRKIRKSVCGGTGVIPSCHVPIPMERLTGSFPQVGPIMWYCKAAPLQNHGCAPMQCITYTRKT